MDIPYILLGFKDYKILFIILDFTLNIADNNNEL